MPMFAALKWTPGSLVSMESFVFLLIRQASQDTLGKPSGPSCHELSRANKLKSGHCNMQAKMIFFADIVS